LQVTVAASAALAVVLAVGAAAVGAAFAALAGAAVLPAASLAAAPLLTPPWWLQAPLPALEDEPSLHVTVAVAASCACSGATPSKFNATTRDREKRIGETFRMVISLVRGDVWKL